MLQLALAGIVALLASGQTAPPRLPSWRFADTIGTPSADSDLGKLKRLELNDGMALDDESASGFSRTNFQKAWMDGFAGKPLTLSEFGVPEKRPANTGLLTVTLWTQPARADEDILVLLDTCVEKQAGEEWSPFWQVRDMFVVSKKEAPAQIQYHVKAMADFLLYKWKKSSEGK